MGTTEQILAVQLERDIFHNEDSKVSGIAKLAVAKGFNTLSPAQQRVLEPFLTQPCSGQTDPGGYHNDCEKVLEGAELLEAYEMSDDGESLQCESCREEAGFYEHQWEKFSQD
ncbi:MAG: hypothetical protein ACRDD9_04800 [Shewanella sp.]|jgi:hypothetical protein